MIYFCAHCGSWWGNRCILCSYCAPHFERLLKAPHRTLAPFKKIYSLWRWDSEHHHFVSTMLPKIKQLASKRQAKLFIPEPNKILPELLGPIQSQYQFSQTQLVWIPLPSPSNPYRNTYVCQVLADYWGGDIWDILRLNSYQEQKRQNRKARKTIRFYSTPIIQKKESTTHLILVDDIITTGATLQAAAYACLQNSTSPLIMYGFTFFSRI